MLQDRMGDISNVAEAVPLAPGFPASFGSAVLEVPAPPEATDAPSQPASAETQCSHRPARL